MDQGRTHSSVPVSQQDVFGGQAYSVTVVLKPSYKTKRFSRRTYYVYNYTDLQTVLERFPLLDEIDRLKNLSIIAKNKDFIKSITEQDYKIPLKGFHHPVAVSWMICRL
jgi:hypothetical protein